MITLFSLPSNLVAAAACPNGETPSRKMLSDFFNGSGQTFVEFWGSLYKQAETRGNHDIDAIFAGNDIGVKMSDVCIIAIRRLCIWRWRFHMRQIS
jgi:hypothetical protein